MLCYDYIKRIGENMDFRKLIEQKKRNSVSLNFEENLNGELEIGVSKFGGKPDLPEDFEWYYFKGESPFDDSVKLRPLSFIAQINCDELKNYDLDNIMPEHGILYFFYEMESMRWGFDPKDNGAAKVFYYEGEKGKLHRLDPPSELAEEYIFPEAKINFERKLSVPSFEELYPDGSSELWDEYDEYIEREGFTTEDNISKLLGYSDLIQNEMTFECELISNGVYCGDGDYYTKENILKYRKKSADWRLLLQLDIVTLNEFELMFGDGGRVYFHIKKDDLANRKFENSWLILQC